MFAELVVEERAVGVVGLERALLDTQQAFDAVASGYDRSNTENRTLSDMRERVRCAVSEAVAPDAHLLDLGCGPGADVVHFANLGHPVTAIDWSPAMVRESQRRVATAGLANSVVVHHLGIHELDRLPPGRFDAAYSNFGPLNCVPDLAASARLIAGRVRRGGLLVASVIGRVCPWELSLYLARGDWSRAMVRFRGGLVPVPLDGRQVWTRYYTPGAIRTHVRRRRVFTWCRFARSGCSHRRRTCRPSPIVIRRSSRRYSGLTMWWVGGLVRGHGATIS